ncbi:ATP-binding protein [Streptomyces xantholiticus]|uniref:ATP-binding protein n=1 Tax=Streptomyces xantholiticus TaxID=68285 RepID=UPI00167B2950|nr:LuxR C-terminal-related transcriptional regulator [Streptomyces xantholiticus]GGW24202.1 helix-turn-helix transcriptional regulator [Streptomyces xantholiticus]
MDTRSDEAADRWLERALSDPPAGGHGTGGPALLLVEGLAGTGKTRLATRLVERAEGRPVRSVTVSFSSYGVAVGVPRPAGAKAPGDVRTPRTPTAPPSTAADPPAADLPSAVDALLEQDDRFLLVAEDVHRADRASLDLLRALVDRPPDGLTAVVTYRPEELREPGLALGKGAHFPAALAVLRLRLGPLDTGQVRALVAEALGESRCPSDLIMRLFECSGGVPQVVADLVGLLRESGDGRERFSVRDLEAVGVPPRLADLALGRTAALGERIRPVAWAAAVLDEPVEAEELSAVAALRGEEGTDALVEALRAGVLREDGEGRYGFFVPMAAAAVYGQVPGPVRREMHRRAATALGRRSPVPWVPLARHRRHGGQVKAWLRAVEHAALQCAADGDHQAAIDLLERTLSRPTVPLSARARLAPLLAHSAVLGLRSDQTVTVLRQILDEQSLPAAVRGQIRLDLGLLLCNQAVAGMQGWLELQQAVEELEERPLMAARAMAALAMPLLSTVPLERNLYWLERAEKAGADSGDEEAATAVAANRAGTLMYIGDPSAWQVLEQLPRETDDPACRQHVARGLCNAADGALWLGQLGPARGLLAEGVELATRSGASYVEQGARGTLLLLDWAEGNWAELATRARAFVAEADTMPGQGVDGRTVLGLMALSRGEWQQATAWLAGEGSRETNGSAVPHVATASGALIRMALVRDDVESAVAEASMAWDRIRDKGVWVWAAELAPWAVDATLRAGRRDTARGMVLEYEVGLEGRQAPASAAALNWCRALLAEAEGEQREAAELYRRAAILYAGLPRPYATVLATEGAARCQLASGADAAAAVGELTSCVEQLTELGAVWDAARIRAELRAHQGADEQRPRGRPSYGDQLSPREQEVADLAATGLTNREIAATLHLSPRTVEQHVARARRKLESQSRQTLSRTRSQRPD